MKIQSVKRITGKVLANAAYSEAVKNANSACIYHWGQPELPERVKKLRKF